MWIPLLRVREKEDMTKGKAKVSPKVKTKERVSLRLGQTIHTTRVLGTISLGISSLGTNRTPMTPRAKEKARKVKTKVKVKVIKVKVVKLPMLSLMLGLKSNLQQLPLGDQPEPELTALFTLEDTMAPKSERREESEPPKARKLEPKRHRGGHHRSERRRADEARKKANEGKMKEMSKEGIPQWIHDKFEISSEETTDECEFANRLEKLKTDPEVLSRLDNVLKEAYEKVYGEIPTSEEAESDELPYNQEPAPGMEDVVHHWETSSRELMSFKELHEKSKTVSNKGHPYVKCQACGKALNSMSLASFWQHVESKNCYPQHALEFWKKEHFQAKG